MATHNTLGALGEMLAAAHLVANGYEILAQNYRYGKAEVDIIATKNKEIIFVEVKTRSSAAFGLPETAVSRRKQEFMLAAASNFMYEKDLEDTEIRFDIIGIVIDKKTQKTIDFSHLENAFFPNWLF